MKTKYIVIVMLLLAAGLGLVLVPGILRKQSRSRVVADPSPPAHVGGALAPEAAAKPLVERMAPVVSLAAQSMRANPVKDAETTEPSAAALATDAARQLAAKDLQIANLQASLTQSQEAISALKAKLEGAQVQARIASDAQAKAAAARQELADVQKRTFTLSP